MRQGVTGGKGRVTDGTAEFDARFWSEAGEAKRIQAIFELRRIYYEVLHPGTGAQRLDRAIGGVRKRGN